jgi:hypothetical protein
MVLPFIFSAVVHRAETRGGLRISAHVFLYAGYEKLSNKPTADLGRRDGGSLSLPVTPCGWVFDVPSNAMNNQLCVDANWPLN